MQIQLKTTNSLQYEQLKLLTSFNLTNLNYGKHIVLYNAALPHAASC